MLTTSNSVWECHLCGLKVVGGLGSTKKDLQESEDAVSKIQQHIKEHETNTDNK